MTSRRLGAVCAMMLFTVSAHCASLDFDFESGPGPNFAIFNTGDLWTVDTDGPDLRISKPADDGTVNPTGFIAGGIQSHFTVTGDFTITVDFFLYDFPPVPLPRLFNESLLSLSFDGGQVFNVLRFEEFKGSFIEAFAAPPDTVLGATASTLSSGRYRISRTGSVVTGLFAPSGSSAFTPLGSVSGWSDPVQVVLMGAQGSRNRDRPTTSLDIGFDNLTISADGIVGLVPPDIDIEKLTNGNQADAANDPLTPRIPPGEAVLWTYQVTNTGGVDISEAEIQVTDSQPGVTPVLDTASDTGGDLLLSQGETWIYTATAQALDLSTAPQGVIVVPGCGDGRNTYENIGRVNITSTAAFDEDASHYCNEVVNLAPVADANGPYTGTSGVAVSFDGSGSSDPDGNIVTYAWDFGDGNGGSGVTPTHTYSAAGTYTVTLTVTDNAGATDSATTSANIDAANLTPVAHAGGPYTGTSGVAVSFDGSGSSDPDGNIVTYAWDFGDGNGGSGVTPTHTYSAAGTYTVTLTVTDNAGATESDSSLVTLNPTASGGGGGGCSISDRDGNDLTLLILALLSVINLTRRLPSRGW